MRSLLALVVLASIGCSGGSGGGTDGDPPPPYRLAFLDVLDPTEETPATMRVAIQTTGGAPVSWSGTIALESLAGPLSPASFEVADGAGEVALVFELAGFGGATFSADELLSETLTTSVKPRLPAKVAGAAAFGAVLGEGAGWDADGAWAPAAVAEGTGVRLYYVSSSGGAPSIGTAYAADGVVFTKATSPVVGPAVSGDACHADGAERPAALRRGDGSVLLIYEGLAGGVRRLCAATSPDGLAFTVAGVALDLGAAGAFDSGAVRGGSLVAREDGSLVLHYGGEASLDADTTQPGNESVSGIGTAVSTNGGLVWTRVAGPVYGAHLTSYLEASNLSSWDGLAIYKPATLRDGPVYRMWLSGLSGIGPRIGLYETTDPFSFSAHVDNLDAELHEVVVVGAAGAFDDDGTELPAVVEAGGARRLYYTGRSSVDGRKRIGLAVFP